MSESLTDRLRMIRRRLERSARRSSLDSGKSSTDRWVDVSTLLELDTDEEFVRAVYLSVLGREPDEAGYSLFLSQVESGDVTRAEILSIISSSLEAKLNNVRIFGLDECFDPSDRTRVEAFVRSVGKHYNGEEPKADSVARWAELIQSRAVTKREMILMFAAAAGPVRCSAADYEKVSRLSALIAGTRQELGSHKRALDALLTDS